MCRRSCTSWLTALSRCFGVYRGLLVDRNAFPADFDQGDVEQGVEHDQPGQSGTILDVFPGLPGKTTVIGSCFCRLALLRNPAIDPLLTTLKAQCLYVLTDDNPPAVEELRTNGSYTSVLLSIAQGQPAADDTRGLTLKVLATGILQNISPLPPLAAASAVDTEDEIVLPLLQPLLTSLSLPEASQEIQALVEKQVREFPL